MIFGIVNVPGYSVIDFRCEGIRTVNKDNIRWQYLSWMMTGPFEFTAAGKKKAPSRNLVLQWVKQSWAEILAEMVRKSFKMCNISNALDGIKDDEVNADDMPEPADDDRGMEDQFETDSKEDGEWKFHSWSQKNKTAPLGATT